MTQDRQKGVTLISLLIASVIGLFLIGVVLRVYQSSKTAFEVRNVVTEVSENQRFALDDMRRILVMTGRGILGTEDGDEDTRAFPPTTATLSTAEATGAEFIFDGGSGGSDILAVRYRKGPSCGSYQDVADTDPASMVRFLLVGTDLVCELTTYSGASATTTRQTLVSGIEVFKVLYGVDDTNDGYANRYLTAPQVDLLTDPSPSGDSSPWARAVSVRIVLAAGSETELPITARKDSVDTLSLLGMNFTEPDTDHLFRVATATVLLRNLNAVVQRQ
jgi:type IV pilus assembly protein PilW